MSEPVIIFELEPVYGVTCTVSGCDRPSVFEATENGAFDNQGNYTRDPETRESCATHLGIVVTSLAGVE